MPTHSLCKKRPAPDITLTRCLTSLVLASRCQEWETIGGRLSSYAGQSRPEAISGTQ